MKSLAFILINNEAMLYKAYLKHEQALTLKNVTALKNAKMEIEAMLKSVV
ncbi:MAG: hypothetical protein WCT07_03035 [Candidatus Paceibacterota bacterium]